MNRVRRAGPSPTTATGSGKCSSPFYAMTTSNAHWDVAGVMVQERDIRVVATRLIDGGRGGVESGDTGTWESFGEQPRALAVGAALVQDLGSAGGQIVPLGARQVADEG